MKHSLKLIMMGAALLVLSALLLMTYASLRATRDVVSKQRKTLMELQNEYENSDIELLDGEIVSAAEASTIARKYRRFCTLYKDNAAIDSNVAISRKLFAEHSNWTIGVELTVNGELKSIHFKSAANGYTEPSTVEDAKHSLVDIVGGHYTDDWRSILDSVTEKASSDRYKTQISDLLGIARNSSWDSIYSSIASAIGKTGNSSILSCEKFSVSPNSSHDYAIQNPAFCYITNGIGAGVIIFKGSSYEVKGDFGIDEIYIDLATKSITNNSNAMLSCTFVVQ